MSSKNLDLEHIFRLYLDHTKREEDAEIIVLLMDYLSHLYLEDEESSEIIELEDLTEYEVDDFLNFYLEDNFDNFKELQVKSKICFENFLQFLTDKKYFNKEEVDEWKEILK